MPDTKLRFLFVINPISGGMSKSEWETRIHEYFKGSIHAYEMYHTHGQHDLTSIKHWVSALKPSRVVAVGGDGTLKLVAEALLGTDIPIGIIPAGSANGMAREMGLPTDIDDCLELLVHGIPRKVDVIRINDSEVCLHLSDIGLNAQLVKYFEERGLRGKLGYARGVLRVWWKRTPMRVYINDGKERIARNAFMVVLANARMYGTGAVINPAGSIQDGIFEVIIVRRLSLIELFRMFFQKRNYDKERIEIIPAQSVDIQVKKKAYFQVDGEYRGKTKEVKALIQHHALCLLYSQSIVPKS